MPNKILDTDAFIVKTLDDLKLIAKEQNIKGYSKLKKSELIAALSGQMSEGKSQQKDPIYADYADEYTTANDKNLCTTLSDGSKRCPIKKIKSSANKDLPSPATKKIIKKEHRAHKLSVSESDDSDGVDDKEKVKNYLKNVSKPKLIEHAIKFNIANPAKMPKKELLDKILENTVALKLEEMSI